MLRSLDPPAGSDAFAPFLSEGPILSWLEPADGGHRLVFSRLQGAAWQPAEEAARSGAMFANWADVPAVVPAADGRLRAHWLEKLGEGTYAYGVRFRARSHKGSGWEDQGWLHSDDLSESEHGFVTWTRDAEDTWVFWLDGRDHESTGAMTLRGGRLEGGAVASRLLDDRVCDCCPTSSAMTATGPVVVYRDRSSEEVRDIASVRWTGEAWSSPSRVFEDGWKIAGCPVNGPAVDADGSQVVVAWFTAPEGKGMVRMAFSGDGGESYSPPVLVDGNGPFGRVDVALLRNGDAAVLWLGRPQDEIPSPGAPEAILSVRRVSPQGRAGEPLAVAHTSAARASGIPRLLAQDDRLVVSWVDGESSRLRAAVLPLGDLPRTPR